MKRSVLFALFAAIFVAPASLLPWEKAQAPLETPWAADVDPANVLPEYPRPIMVREAWKNLNGVWDFEPIPSINLPLDAILYSREILVPFPWESALSGIREQYKDTWSAAYRRSFSIPEGWMKDDSRLLLHFGAVDWHCRVFVNGSFAGEHKGGFDAFFFDIGNLVLSDASNELVVLVYDPGNEEGIAVGKQSNRRFEDSGRYTYSPASGIWQTVWLEPVPETYLHDFRIVPDIDREHITVTVNTNTQVEGIETEVIVRIGERVVSRSGGRLFQPFQVEIPNPRLWWPEDPFLYDVDILLKTAGGTIVDAVESYFGMRKISLGEFYQDDRGRPRGPFQKILLNNEFVFQMGPLDQGYWPDGLFTAPTDAALKWDVEQTKAWGYNMTRKHIKVEPQRWFYWCDKLGLLVWQDMPSTFRVRTEEEKTQFELELDRMVKTHWNHPSVVNWIVFNEHWGAYDVVRLTQHVMELDPSRLVTGNSGIDAGTPDLDYEVGHIKDNHHYRPPTNPFPSTHRAVVNGEYGAIGYKIPGHIWNPDEDDGDWVHHNYAGIDAATEEYERFIEMLHTFKERDALSGAVYTQWTDLESEMNGIYTYDRKQEKLHRDRVTRANRSLWEDDRNPGGSPDEDSTAVEDLDGGPDTID